MSNSQNVNIEEGLTLEDDHGETYVVESVQDGQVHFEDFYDHWVDEVEGFIEDGLWTPREDGNGD